MKDTKLATYFNPLPGRAKRAAEAPAAAGNAQRTRQDDAGERQAGQRSCLWCCWLPRCADWLTLLLAGAAPAAGGTPNVADPDDDVEIQDGASTAALRLLQCLLQGCCTVRAAALIPCAGRIADSTSGTCCSQRLTLLL